MNEPTDGLPVIDMCDTEIPIPTEVEIQGTHYLAAARVSWQTQMAESAALLAERDSYRQTCVSLKQQVAALKERVKALTPKEAPPTPLSVEEQVEQVVDIMEGRVKPPYLLKSAEDLVGSKNGAGA